MRLTFFLFIAFLLMSSCNNSAVDCEKIIEEKIIGLDDKNLEVRINLNSYVAFNLEPDEYILRFKSTGKTNILIEAEGIKSLITYVSMKKCSRHLYQDVSLSATFVKASMPYVDEPSCFSGHIHKMKDRKKQYESQPIKTNSKYLRDYLAKYKSCINNEDYYFSSCMLDNFKIYSKSKEISDKFPNYLSENTTVSICGYFLLRDNCPIFEVHSINTVDELRTLLIENNRLQELSQKQ